MALSLPSIPSISVARRSYRLSTATILNSQISIPPFKSPRRVSFISRHQCAVVDASSRVFVPQTAVVDRNSVSLAEFKSEEELWAAVRLRIRTFYEFNQSSVGVEVGNIFVKFPSVYCFAFSLEARALMMHDRGCVGCQVLLGSQDRVDE